MPDYLRVSVLSVVVLLCLTGESLAQSCACPPKTSCKPCSGGYTSLTLRYNGKGVALILIKDGLNIIADLTVSPGQEFTIKGSKKNEKFATSAIPVIVNGVRDAILGPSCSDVQVGLTYGAFTVVAAESMGGSTVCCISPPPDVIPPRITNVPDPVTIDATSACSAQVAWPEPIASDNCTLKSFTSTHDQGTVFPLGRTNVIYTATDEAGLISTASFVITVVDKTAPVFTSFPDDIVAVAQPGCTARVSWSPPIVSDACSTAKVTSSVQSDAEFPIGITKVKFVATDESGNNAEKELTITVQDERKLEIIGCPNDIRLTADEHSLTNVSWILPSIAVLCEEVTLISNHKPGDIFATGITEVEYSASTPSGKTAACRFNVIIDLEVKRIEASKLVTPDGDGHNDEWIVSNIENYRDNHVLIFDRWGGIIFQAARYDNESVVWKGTNKSGGAVPTGTYFYSISAHDGNQRIQETGSVELVR